MAHRYGVGLINLELCWFVFVGVHAGREEVQEAPQKVKVLASHVGHLEYGADPGEKGGREGRMRMGEGRRGKEGGEKEREESVMEVVERGKEGGTECIENMQ